MDKEEKDDFFGIETLTSLNFEQKTPNSAPNEKVQPEKKLPGVEFFDSAFFPEINDVPKTSIESIQTTSRSNYVDEQYFGNSSHQETPEKHQNEWVEGNFMEEKKHFEESSLRSTANNVVEELLSEMIPVWKMDRNELVEYISSQVLYSDDKIIAFNKPYGMAYSGGPSNRPQFDRLLQDVKSVVAPKVERLHLVKSIDRNISGILLFATSSATQNDLINIMRKGKIISEYRGVVRGRLSSHELKVNVPLFKSIKENDMKLLPVLDSLKTKKDIQFVETEFRELGDGASRYCSYIGITVRREIPHQIRAHLLLNNCPLIGERKYTTDAPRPPKFGDYILRLLGISPSQARRLPMLLHHKQMEIPEIGQAGRSLIINSPLPSYFSFLLKKLKLFKR